MLSAWTHTHPVNEVCLGGFPVCGALEREGHHGMPGLVERMDGCQALDGGLGEVVPEHGLLEQQVDVEECWIFFFC